jgi:hypothetical protein
MKIGPLVLPEGPVILLGSILIAAGCGRLLAKEPATVERAILLIVAVGLLVARLIFVLRYLPAYKDAGLGSALDILDLGFDRMAGAWMGAVMLGGLLWCKRSIRIPLLAAAVAGGRPGVPRRSVQAWPRQPQPSRRACSPTASGDCNRWQRPTESRWW